MNNSDHDMFQGASVLITGVLGFIGSNLGGNGFVSLNALADLLIEINGGGEYERLKHSHRTASAFERHWAEHPKCLCRRR